ncbi:PREDICTED: cytochrome P450 4F22-like [Amphimedon queenslandica]|uniref:Cytochrome P450 n=1 Tax=Amphimedon queenslandica TaxID=400682 RepID=A0A1X7UX56_AMPQE|nr:PREDICTED: cytochrome P450 4F22-like [Amphimedon queenslandica]|eukprot:XP_019851689.1 PREDICTED: cytochrome P450 4F22-like [Amphimedon queenslandica]
MALVFLLLFLFSLCLLFLPKRLWRYYNLCKAMRKLPVMAPPHWFWGHANFVEFSQSFATKAYAWRTENNIDINCFWLGPFRAFVMLHAPEHFRTVIKNPKSPDAYAMLEPWLGRGLLIENGSRWLRNRRLLTPAFHFDVLKPYVHVYNDCTDILLSKWKRSALNGETVEVYNTINQLTLDVILRCACSHFSSCQEKGKVDPYVDAVLEICNLSVSRFMNPVLAASNDFIYFYLTPQGWRYRRALREAHKHSEKIIKERKAVLMNEGRQERIAKSKLKCLDFLDILLLANKERKDGDGLSDLEIRYEVDTFVFEGYDTTANALTWMLYYLAKYPEIQEKCREEVRDVLRGRNQLDYDDLSKLQYTQCCIKEAMRLNPPVFNIVRSLTEDITIGGYYIPKEADVVIDIGGIHRSPNVWENPLEYNPLRFHPDHAKDRDPFSYVPFSAGPRNCIGQNFAFNEEQVVIASILNKFSLEIRDERIKQQLDFLPLVLLRPAEELHLKLTLLSQ